MADDDTGVSGDKNEAAETNQPDLEDNLYDSMEGDKKPADDAEKNLVGDETKDKQDGEADDKADAETDDGDKKEKSVEDDNLIGKEEAEEDSKDEKSEDDKADDKSDDEKDKAPEDYKLQISEESLLGAEAVKQAEEYAKKHGLSQEAAEGHLKAKEEAVNEYQEFLDSTAEKRAQETMTGMKKTWLAESKADSELGGDKFAETVAKGNRFINAAANPEFREILKTSGLGNHKAFMALCAKGADLAGLMDDKVDLGGDTNETEKALEDNLYTTMK